MPCGGRQSPPLPLLAQVLLVKKALQLLGVQVASVPSTYWNLPKHLNQSREEAAALYATEDRFWRHGVAGGKRCLGGVAPRHTCLLELGWLSLGGVPHSGGAEPLRAQGQARTRAM